MVLLTDTIITVLLLNTGRQPVGLEAFLGSIVQLTNGDMKKASLVDIGMSL